MRAWLPTMLTAVALTTPSLAIGQEQYLLVISGLGGDEAHSERFHEWSLRLLDAAAAAGLSEDRRLYLAEDPERDPERIDGRSSKEELGEAIRGLVSRSGPQDEVWIVIVGHGSAAGGRARLNLPGPDVTAEDFAELLRDLEARLVFVNTSSSSGPFIAALSGPGRAIVTATKSAGQRNETLFADFFTQALGEGAADLDKNGRTSLLEAFDYSRTEVAKHYDANGLLATENPLLDDNGDGQGSLEPALLARGEEGEDGLVASRLFFGTGGEGASASVSPELAALIEEKALLERRVEELRLQKGNLDEELYLTELEKLLLELALKDERIRLLRSPAAEAESGDPAGEAGAGAAAGSSEGPPEETEPEAFRR